MKLNLANPATGLQKIVEVDDEKKLLPFFEKRMGAEVDLDSIGDEFKGYVFRITGGNDKQGFPMMQGILVNHRVRLLFTKGMKCYRPRRKGEKKRKSVRGCIVGPDLSVLNLLLMKKGPDDIPGLTDGEKPRRLGPKRAGNIRKLFNLSQTEDVRTFVVRRKIEGKKNTKAPRVQRLITASRIQRKRREKAYETKNYIASKAAAQAYQTMLAKHKTTLKEKRFHDVAKSPTKSLKPAAASNAASASTKAPVPTSGAKPSTDKKKPVAAAAKGGAGKAPQQPSKPAATTGQAASKQSNKPQASAPKSAAKGGGKK